MSGSSYTARKTTFAVLPDSLSCPHGIDAIEYGHPDVDNHQVRIQFSGRFDEALPVVNVGHQHVTATDWHHLA